MTDLTTEFMTYHKSGKDLHLRTTHMILFISKTQEDLLKVAMNLQRGQKIKVTGEVEISSTLSNEVMVIESLDLV